MSARVARVLLALFFVVAGANHFVSPRAYLQIVPPIFPAPEALVQISGVAEIAGGLGVLVRPFRRAAGVGLIALLLAVFPANVYAVARGMTVGGHDVPRWLLWLRLPFQALFIWWVYIVCWKQTRVQPTLPRA